MALRSVFEMSFLNQVHDWIEQNGEVFIVIRYAYMAGAKDYLFLNSKEHFNKLINTLPSMADVIVFKERQLPIRGIASDDLLKKACEFVPDGEYWFLLTRYGDSPGDFYSDGDKTHEALAAAFNEFQGKCVAIGLDPPFFDSDNANMQSALIPMPDGTVKSGAY